MKYLFLIVVLAVLAVAVTGVTLYGVRLTNEQYDRLKGIVIKWSGITTLLGVIVATFEVPYGEQTITTVAAIGAFLAYMLGVSDKHYTDGTVQTETDWVEDDENENENHI